MFIFYYFLPPLLRGQRNYSILRNGSPRRAKVLSQYQFRKVSDHLPVLLPNPRFDHPDSEVETRLGTPRTKINQKCPEKCASSSARSLGGLSVSFSVGQLNLKSESIAASSAPSLPHHIPRNRKLNRLSEIHTIQICKL